MTDLQPPETVERRLAEMMYSSLGFPLQITTVEHGFAATFAARFAPEVKRLIEAAYQQARGHIAFGDCRDTSGVDWDTLLGAIGG